MRRVIPISLLWACCLSALTAAGGRTPASTPRQTPAVVLEATAHTPLPRTLADYWLVPPPTWMPGTAAERTAAAELSRALTLIETGRAAQALAIVKPQMLTATPLAPYASYIRGRAYFKLGRFAEARSTFAATRTTSPVGALSERLVIAEADAAEALNDYAGSLTLHDTIGTPRLLAGDEWLSRIVTAAAGAGDVARATDTRRRLYFEFPASDAATNAAAALGIASTPPPAAGTDAYTAEAERAERLFSARRYALARDGYLRLLATATGDQLEVANLRIAECDHFLRQHQAAIARLVPMIATASRQAEARFFILTATREAGSHERYVALAQEFIAATPVTSWTEDALNNLATHYILVNEDEAADVVFRESLVRFPAGRFAPRAAWKVGWWAYKHGQYLEAARVFERAAATFTRSDYRPSWVYWSGRARERLLEVATAADRYRLVQADYAHSYYGRLANERLSALRPLPTPAARTTRAPRRAQVTAAPAIPTSNLVAWLIHARLYDAALDEVAFAQKAWGRTAPLDATRAWLLNQTGALRPGIALMRQTYPQFLTADAATMPREILSVIFPLDHWPLIRQYAVANKLDPFLVAALVAQESTFDPEARSVANAIGLMQIVPSTGKRWARKLAITRFSARALTNPTTNMRIGTAYFADQIKRFGGVHLALAGYNAGDSRVSRWMAERPGVAREEFIDDIPFPETQNYVKRILGTAEDYRRIYGHLLPDGGAKPAAKTAARRTKGTRR